MISTCMQIQPSMRAAGAAPSRRKTAFRSNREASARDIIKSNRTRKIGAGGRNRTDTLSPEPDFESGAHSHNTLIYNTEMGSEGQVCMKVCRIFCVYRVDGPILVAIQFSIRNRPKYSRLPPGPQSLSNQKVAQLSQQVSSKPLMLNPGLCGGCGFLTVNQAEELGAKHGQDDRGWSMNTRGNVLTIASAGVPVEHDYADFGSAAPPAARSRVSIAAK